MSFKKGDFYMKTCPSCKAVMDDSTLFCTSCGTKLDETPVYQAPVNPNPAPAYQAPVNPNPAPAYQAPVNPNPAPAYQAPVNPNPAPAYQAPMTDPTDHTSEFAADDVAENKPFALLIYIGGIIGLIIALFLKKDSAYLKFHIRQGIKIYLAETLLTVICSLAIVLVVPFFVYSVAMIILIIVRLICFLTQLRASQRNLPLLRVLTSLNFKYKFIHAIPDGNIRYNFTVILYEVGK